MLQECGRLQRRAGAGSGSPPGPGQKPAAQQLATKGNARSRVGQAYLNRFRMKLGQKPERNDTPPPLCCAGFTALCPGVLAGGVSSSTSVSSGICSLRSVSLLSHPLSDYLYHRCHIEVFFAIFFFFISVSELMRQSGICIHELHHSCGDEQIGHGYYTVGRNELRNLSGTALKCLFLYP